VIDYLTLFLRLNIIRSAGARSRRWTVIELDRLRNKRERGAQEQMIVLSTTLSAVGNIMTKQRIPRTALNIKLPDKEDFPDNTRARALD
jgi:hypothetical protein